MKLRSGNSSSSTSGSIRCIPAGELDLKFMTSLAPILPDGLNHVPYVHLEKKERHRPDQLAEYLARVQEVLETPDEGAF